MGVCAHLVDARLDTSPAPCARARPAEEACVSDCSNVTKPPPLGAHPVKPVGTRHGKSTRR